MLSQLCYLDQLGTPLFWLVCLKRTDMVLCNSSGLLDCYVIFTIVTSIDEIKLIYMAVVSFFMLSPVVFCKLSSKFKAVSNFSLEKCHDRPSPE